METPRLLFVHAHPDDETLTTGATIAHYTALGAQVWVVTCTLGEEGEVIGEQWAGLAVDHADQLGGFRVGELTAALTALGVDRPRYLGGAGRWRDSGMAGTPSRGRERFVDGNFAEQTDALAASIDELRPHVVVTYDPNGGYGHPDHIHAHRVTTAAVDAARWQVPKFYWTVMSASALAAGDTLLAQAPDHWTRIPLSSLPFDAYADDAIDAALDLTAQLPAKVAALRAHQTQVSVSGDGRFFALSNTIALPVSATEHYVLAAGHAGRRNELGWETDLLAGLKIS
ncbi:N-acetyl-1-D-myo-inositol-2-amino-2-deoxy-alpha-D-glucopyranoside deacetylase [Mycobacterium sp. SMC-4]|uniref:N-acetyl-1-D-myo-inositol-2-amino-2-deoxy-alpha- D-glucopyranoside deacetylase n=1 Tax=Mycobacterium sp. SMC-4 TaxID=2857059 RepID=UPI0021B2CA4F|nr:N-acetyl-1-D-myo-inositol-2-amino-2-deoxy-alpha-D-glucopyranoside deacetylase [Mycobacterium sp. SMC-4]UXA16847.1 N-acetyl-1-D-myo-inositol-2-amino-2-deoxy-alpha-D-glucopyranoside deacetylase [Mycobacterium sp. SMC-4]